MILVNIEDIFQAIAVVEQDYKTNKEAPGSGKSDPAVTEAYQRGRDRGLDDCKRAIKGMINGKIEMAEGWLKSGQNLMPITMADAKP